MCRLERAKFPVLMILLVGLALSGCYAFKRTPTPLPTVVLESNRAAPASSSKSQVGGVTASGVVVPARQIQMASVSGGIVEAVNAEEGERVAAGQVLVRLGGGEKLAAAVEAANLELLMAQQDLKMLFSNADLARTAAQLRLANAQKALDEADKRRTWRNYRPGSQSDIEAAQAALILAKDTLQKAQDAYSGVADRAEDDVIRASALSALSAAQKAYDRALANLNYLLALPNQVDVDQAEAVLQSAKAEVADAQKEFNKLKNGPDPDALALAEERIKNARAQLTASQAALADLELKAPFDGTVGRVNIHSGEWVIPGQAILVLVDLDHLRVETTDLSERNIPGVKIGQTATVTIKALGQDVEGKVSEISPLADTLGGDVVYKVVIDLDTIPSGLRAGMTVDVQFAAVE